MDVVLGYAKIAQILEHRLEQPLGAADVEGLVLEIPAAQSLDLLAVNVAGFARPIPSGFAQHVDGLQSRVSSCFDLSQFLEKDDIVLVAVGVDEHNWECSTRVPHVPQHAHQGCYANPTGNEHEILFLWVEHVGETAERGMDGGGITRLRLTNGGREIAQFLDRRTDGVLLSGAG